MRNSFRNQLLAAVLTYFAAHTALAHQAYVAGPIEQFDQNAKHATILSQKITIDQSTLFFINGRPLAASQASRFAVVGTFVYAEMAVSNGLLIAKTIAVVPSSYVPGASRVFVGGVMSAVDTARGLATVGGLQIDVSAADPSISSQLAVGTFVELSAVQPLPRGKLVSTEIRGVGGSGVLGVGGSGAAVLGVGGSGVLGVGGSRALGVGGSGVLGVGGSGALGVGGSGALGVRGSGALGVGGSGALGVGGSGALGVGGSGALGVGGSGKLGVGGSGTLGVGGSG